MLLQVLPDVRMGVHSYLDGVGGHEGPGDGVEALGLVHAQLQRHLPEEVGLLPDGRPAVQLPGPGVAGAGDAVEEHGGIGTVGAVGYVEVRHGLGGEEEHLPGGGVCVL